MSVRLEGSSEFGDSVDGFSYPPPLSSQPASISRMTLYPPSLRVRRSRWCRNVDLLPIDYAFQPRLRNRLTLGGMALPRKPLAYGERDSHPLYRYSSRQNHLDFVQESLPSPFTRVSNAPLPMYAFTTHILELRLHA